MMWVCLEGGGGSWRAECLWVQGLGEGWGLVGVGGYYGDSVGDGVGRGMGVAGGVQVLAGEEGHIGSRQQPLESTDRQSCLHTHMYACTHTYTHHTHTVCTHRCYVNWS